MSRPAGALLASVMVAALTACGWQLRGAGGASLDGRAVFVDSRLGEGEPTRTVARELVTLGADLVQDRAVSELVLVLIDERIRRRTVTVDQRGRATTYELDYRLRYRVEEPGGEILLTQRAAVADQTYDVDPDDTLGTRARRDRATEELRAESARLMLSRMSGAFPERD